MPSVVSYRRVHEVAVRTYNQSSGRRLMSISALQAMQARLSL